MNKKLLQAAGAPPQKPGKPLKAARTSLNNMAQPELAQYIRDCLEAGHDPEEVRKACLQTGWQPEEVETAFDEANEPATQKRQAAEKNAEEKQDETKTGAESLPQSPGTAAASGFQGAAAPSAAPLPVAALIGIVLLIALAGGAWYAYDNFVAKTTHAAVAPLSDASASATAQEATATKAPAEQPSATATATPQPTPEAPAEARAQEAAQAADCGTDFGCLIEASKTCAGANALKTATVNFFGINFTGTSSYTIFPEGEKCVLYTRSESMSVKYGPEITSQFQEQGEAQNLTGVQIAKAIADAEKNATETANATSAGLDGTCRFKSNSELAWFLQKTDAGNLSGKTSCSLTLGGGSKCNSTGDWSVAECDGPLYGGPVYKKHADPRCKLTPSRETLEMGVENGLVGAQVSVSGYNQSAEKVSWQSLDSLVAEIDAETGEATYVSPKKDGTTQIIVTDNALGGWGYASILVNVSESHPSTVAGVSYTIGSKTA